MHRCTKHALYRSKYDNRTIASTHKMKIRTVQRAQGDEKKFPTTVMVFGVLSSEGHIMPPHIFEVGLNVNTKVYLDVLKGGVIPWCNQVAGGRPWVWQQNSALAHKSKETQTWLQKECYDSVPFSHCPPEPTGLLHLVIRREHRQHDLPQHLSKPDRCHPPSLCKIHAPSSGSVSRR